MRGSGPCSSHSGGAPPNHFHPFLVQNFGYSFSNVASEASDIASGTEVEVVEEMYSCTQPVASRATQPATTKPVSSGGGDAANNPRAPAE